MRIKMTGILEDIASTELEGSSEFRRVTDVCKECNTVWPKEGLVLHQDNHRCRVGATLTGLWFCPVCEKSTLWIVTKVAPYKPKTHD